MQLRPIEWMCFVLSAFSLAQVSLVLHHRRTSSSSCHHISIAGVVRAQGYLTLYLNMNLVDGRVYLIYVGLAIAIVKFTLAVVNVERIIVILTMNLLIHLVVIDSIGSLAFLRSWQWHIGESWDVLHFVSWVQDAEVFEILFGKEVFEAFVKVTLNEVDLLIVLVYIIIAVARPGV